MELGWDIKVDMYPTCVNLMDSVPRASDLTLSKLAKCGMVMTDTCSTAHKFWQLLIKEITNHAKQKGWSADEIKIFESNCLQHLWNVWFGAVIKQLCKVLQDLLE